MEDQYQNIFVSEIRIGNKTYIKVYPLEIIHLENTQDYQKRLRFPLLRIRQCAYQGARNVGFSGKFLVHTK